MSRRGFTVLVAAVLVAAAGALTLRAPAQDKDKAVRADPKAGRKVALLVGVNNCNADFAALDYAEKDVAELAVVLGNLGYEVVLLTGKERGPTDPKHPVPSAALVREHLAAVVKNLTAADTVLVALSGHGAHLSATDKCYFCPSGTKLDDTKTLVGIDEIMAAFESSKAGSKVLLVDACRNDSTRNAKELKSDTRPVLPDLPGGTVALFSCGKGQKAYESKKNKSGYLFHYVIEGLNGRAADKRTGEIGWQELAGYVSKQLPLAVSAEKGTNVTQTPEVMSKVTGNLILGKVHITHAIRPLTPPFTAKDVALSRLDYDSTGRPLEVVARAKTPTEMRLVYIPAGTFTMGADEPTADVLKEFPVEYEARIALESPARPGEFVTGFYMATTEVTMAQFREFVKATGYKTDQERNGATENSTGAASDEDKRAWDVPLPNTKQKGDNEPVAHITHNDATAYCAWLSEKEGRKHRLPTSKEWEYACRAGTTTRYWCGNDPEGLAKIANVPDGTASKSEGELRSVGLIRIDRGKTPDKKTIWANQWFRAGVRMTYEDQTKDKVIQPTWTRTDNDATVRNGHVKIHNASTSVLVVSNGTREDRILVNQTLEIKYQPLGKSLSIEAEDGYADLAPVGKFAANAFGLYDMHGNVWEWCADTMKNADGKEMYVMRGGCFLLMAFPPTGCSSHALREDESGTERRVSRCCRDRKLIATLTAGGAPCAA